MTDINDFVDVTITRETATVQRASFAVPCFLAAHVAFAERARSYTSTKEVLEDFTSTSTVYKAAQKYFGQDRGLKTIVIGRRQVPGVVITPTVANNAVYSFTLEGETITFTSDGSATATEICDGLRAAITSAGITTVDDSGTTTLILAPHVAGNGYEIKDLSANLSMALDAVTEEWADGIAAVRTTNDTWYQLSTDSHVEADILDIAAEIETLPKVYAFSSAASAIKTSSTSDIFSQLKALAYDRTFYMWNALADTVYPECAWVGYFAPDTPGSNIWEIKTLSGVTADSLTSGEANYIKGKNGSTYENVQGKSVVVGGKVASNEFIDVTVFSDWYKSRLQEVIFLMQFNAKKIGFTPAGAAIYEGEIRRATAEGIQVGGLADSPAPVITVPNVLNLSAAQRATRTLPDITVSARLAGAINKVVINVTVSA